VGRYAVLDDVALADCAFEIEGQDANDERPGVRGPVRIFASEALRGAMDRGMFEQVMNVACLPGIVRAALCMPDDHWGYGFPIGNGAAFRADTGVISFLHRLDISRKGVSLTPIGNIKG
jgi:hypothetical protein